VQPWHVPEQTKLQQTLSTQKPLAHWSLPVHGEASTFVGVQVPPLLEVSHHCIGHWESCVQDWPPDALLLDDELVLLVVDELLELVLPVLVVDELVLLVVLLVLEELVLVAPLLVEVEPLLAPPFPEKSTSPPRILKHPDPAIAAVMPSKRCIDLIIGSSLASRRSQVTRKARRRPSETATSAP
jgi:hypothetical protein